MKALVNRGKWLNLVNLFCVCMLFSIIGKANDTAGIFNGWQTVGPGGGDVRAIAVDPKDKNRVYITTLDGQVYSSPDAGNSWQFLVNFNRPHLVLDNLIIDSRDSKVIYTAGFRGATDPGGFYKTTDGGLTWKESKELKNEAINAMVQSPFDPNTLLVGTTKEVWISKNSGDDWKKIEPVSKEKPYNIDSLAIDPRDGNTIYAGTYWRPYKTVDGGKNWKLISKGMIDDSDVFTMDVDPRNPDNIFASACSGIYFSSDKGETWSKANGIPSSARRTRDLLQHPSVAGRVYAATTEGFWMSSDNGKSGSWTLSTSKELEINSIAVHPDAPNRVYIATNNYGVMISNDGGKTFSVNNGNFTSRMAISIVPDIERPNRLYATTNNTATGGGFIFISDDDGITWRPSTKNLSVIRIAPSAFLQDRKNPNIIYLGTNMGMYRSIDRGVSWTQIVAPPKPAPVKRAPVKRKAPAKTTTAKAKATAPKPVPAPETAEVKPTVIKVDALNERINQLIYTEDGKDGILAATNSGLYRTYDINSGWEKLPFGTGMDTQVLTVATSSGASDTYWVGTVNSGVLFSTDKGASWQKASVNSEYPITAIAINPQNSSIIYVGTKITFYMSRDGGKSWLRRGGDLPLGSFTSILINPNNPNEIFLGSSMDTTGGVYQTINGGDTWKRLDSKDTMLPSRRIRTMAFDPKNPNRIFAGTHSGGFFRIERTPMTASEETGSRPRTVGN